MEQQLSISDMILLKKEIESELNQMEKLSQSNIEPNWERRKYLAIRLERLNYIINQTIDGI
jgi:hypothetical protein